MADRVVLRLRADTLQETILHELAEASGSYGEQGLDVVAETGTAVDGLEIGLASSLLEQTVGGPACRILLVACTEPLFWATGPRATGAPGPAPIPRTVQQLLQLALRRNAGADVLDPADVDVLSPAAAPAVATGRIRPRVDVGALARFPAVGIAARPGVSETGRTSRVVAAHRSALRCLEKDPVLVESVLERRYGIAPADAPALATLLRRRFRPTPLRVAEALAREGLADLGMDPSALDGAFGTTEVQA